MAERLRRFVLFLTLAFGCFLLCISDSLGTVTLGPALFVVVACLGVASLLAMIRES